MRPLTLKSSNTHDTEYPIIWKFTLVFAFYCVHSVTKIRLHAMHTDIAFDQRNKSVGIDQSSVQIKMDDQLLKKRGELLQSYYF